MSRRSAGMSKKKSVEERNQSEINLILKDYCSHCNEPATGKDRCNSCEIGQRLADLYWLQRAANPEYGA